MFSRWWSVWRPTSESKSKKCVSLGSTTPSRSGTPTWVSLTKRARWGQLITSCLCRAVERSVSSVFLNEATKHCLLMFHWDRKQAKSESQRLLLPSAAQKCLTNLFSCQGKAKQHTHTHTHTHVCKNCGADKLSFPYALTYSLILGIKYLKY